MSPAPGCCQLDVPLQRRRKQRDLELRCGAKCISCVHKSSDRCAAGWVGGAGTSFLHAQGREMRSFSAAHKDIEFNVLMSRDYHIWETLINLCLPPWVLLSSLLPTPPLPRLLLSIHVIFFPPEFCLPPLLQLCTQESFLQTLCPRAHQLQTERQQETFLNTSRFYLWCLYCIVRLQKQKERWLIACWFW